MRIVVIALRVCDHPAMTAAASPPVRLALGTCPAHVQRLSASQLPAARRAVVSAVHLKGARVVQVRFTHRDGDILPARPCAAIDRSVLVHLNLPRVRLQSLYGNPVYYVARTTSAWVIWFQAH
jgi:hypothetical protein